MWQLYKKTLIGMQLMIGGVTFAVCFWSHLPSLAALFFVTMQVCAVLGAMWGSRLQHRFSNEKSM